MCAYIGEVTTLSLYIAVFSCPNLSPPFSLTRLTWKSFNITTQGARISMISFYHLDTARPGSPNARVKTDAVEKSRGAASGLRFVSWPDHGMTIR